MSPLVTPPFAPRGGTADNDALPELFATTELGLTPDDYAELLASKRGNDERIAVHVRLPFCPSRCLNCDHHTTVTHNSEAIDEYIVDLEREIGALCRALAPKMARPLSTQADALAASIEDT